jgi:hypothetical protein
LSETFRFGNKTESLFAQKAEAKGWTVSKIGWPDFFCQKPDGSIILVEVKPKLRDGSGHKRLRKSQKPVLDGLAKAGVPCYIFDGETLRRYKPQN